MAAEQTVAVPTTAIVILTGAAIFAFGYAMAVVKRANRDYKATKAAVKALRRGFWSTWWVAVKRGVVIVLVGVVLVVWSAREVSRNQDGATPVPASVTPAPSPS
jgi:heme/copper-type cytochrome/quinol oxidase subunit 2